MKGVLPGLLGALLLAAAGSAAVAQVAVNQGALDQLRPEAAPSERDHHGHPHPPRRPEPPAAPAPRQAAVPRPGATPSPAGPNAGPKPQVPAVAPTPAAIPPPAVIVPTAPAPPLPTIAVADDAPGSAEPIPGGVRVTFGKDRADLNPGLVAAIRQVAAEAKARPGALDLVAYAAGSPDDPSTPRRLSLSRALAVRAVLLHEGIDSPRIYVHALGAADPQPGAPAAPADRVDLTQQGVAPAPPGAQAAGR